LFSVIESAGSVTIRRDASRNESPRVFVLGKLFLWLSAPANILFVVLIFGAALLWLPWRRAARGVITATVIIMCLIATLPIGRVLITILEDRFPTLHEVEQPVDGIIVLGGAFNVLITEARGQLAIGVPSERLIEFAALGRRYPAAKMVFTGGAGYVLRPDLKEAVLAHQFFTEIGFDAARVVYESESRSTFDNAVFSYDLVKPVKGERWLLVTSAGHMPRAVGCFRKVGWDVIAYPVDYHTSGKIELAGFFDFAGGLGALNGAAYEWLGLMSYWILGRTSALLPGP
jgi:uncharacterized SAM-binding protein YcdF (DUF218 family)